MRSEGPYREEEVRRRTSRDQRKRETNLISRAGTFEGRKKNALVPYRSKKKKKRKKREKIPDRPTSISIHVQSSQQFFY